LGVKQHINVLLLITELNVGGAERIVEQLASGLLRDRYNVKVACLYDPHAIGADIQAAGIPVIDLDMRNKVDLRAPYRLFRLLQAGNVQILHAHLFHANFLAATVGRLARVPVIIATRHSVEIGGRRREWINRLVRPLCDAVVAVSREVYEAEVRRSEIDLDKLVMIPSGVGVQIFEAVDQASTGRLQSLWKIRPEFRLVGTVGRFVEPKGYTYLLDALAKIRTQISDAKALLVGDGALRQPMEEKARELGLSDTVVFTGTRRDVPQVLALLDVFVLPSLWEGLPIALLEAMAAGLPVVATAVGGTPEVVVDGVTGILVPPRDPDALAEAILTLLHDPDLRRKMGQAGRERVRGHFSVEKMVKETEGLYRRLLTEKGLA
jgi:glycosyltransferase involved in cell wall biosynthesis